MHIKPRHFSAAILPVILLVVAAAVHGQEAAAGPVETIEVPMVTELRVIDGRPTLFIDGKPHDGLFCSVRARNMQNFIDAGFDIFDTFGGNAAVGWTGPGRFDFESTDRHIEAFLAQKPDAKLIIRMWMGYPQQDNWWAAANPHEKVLSVGLHLNKNSPSIASKAYREEAGEALRRMVSHMEEKYGRNILAYVPGGGPNGEWFHWYAHAARGGPDDETLALDDYSEPMRRAYQEYVLEKYGSVEAVNAAYRLELGSINELELPTPQDRQRAREGNLRNAAAEAAVVDFYEAFNKEMADTLIHWAGKVKEGCDRRKVVMAFFGYQWVENTGGGLTAARSGHTALDAVLGCEDLDYIIAPFHYTYRQMEGVTSGQGVVAAALQRGKQYVHEFDGSTYLKACWPCPDHHMPQTAAETGELLRRDLNKALMEGASLWFMDLSGGMYNSPEMVEQLRQTLEAGREHAFTAGINNRQVAVVLNSRDGFYFRENEPLRAILIDQFKQWQLERMGLQYDDLTLDNLKYLDPADTARYKLWIFPSTVHLTEDERELIRQHCLRNGNAVLWVYAPGIIAADGLDAEATEKLTGFRLGWDMTPGELAVRTEEVDHWLLSGRRSPIVYGTYGEPSTDLVKYHAPLRQYPGSEEGFSISPRFYIAEGGQWLGRLLDVERGRHAGLAVREMDGWTSVLSVAPMVPKHILRNLAAHAGCHVYTDFPAQVVNSKNYVGIFAHDAGECLVRLPQRSRVVEVYSGKVLAEDTDRLTLPLKLNQTVLLHALPPVEEESGKFILRINCGSYSDSRDADGNLWRLDRPWEPGDWGYVTKGGGIAGCGPNQAIAETERPDLYRCERYGMSEYRVTLPDGRYKVTLHFAELFGRIRGPGQRRFNVIIEGEPVLTNFDVLREAGEKFRALPQAFEVQVNDGELNIEFEAVQDAAIVQAIEIEQQ